MNINNYFFLFKRANLRSYWFEWKKVFVLDRPFIKDGYQYIVNYFFVINCLHLTSGSQLSSYVTHDYLVILFRIKMLVNTNII